MPVSIIATFLKAAAEAKDLSDINIAAGAAMQDLEAAGRRLRGQAARSAALATLSLVGVTFAADAFAASPIHVGVITPKHVFTHLGARDWSPYGAAVFGHPLPWGTRD